MRRRRGPPRHCRAKNCILYGLDVVVFEKGDKVGGNWVLNVKTGHSSVYENTHIISSKVWSEYEDFPMPDEYPDYPSKSQVSLTVAASRGWLRPSLVKKAARAKPTTRRATLGSCERR